MKSISDVINLFFISDIHFAQDASDTDLLVKDLKDKPPNRYIIGIGDELDSISRADKRHKLEDLKDRYIDKKLYPKLIQAEMEDLANLYAKHTNADEWLGHISGNHPLVLCEQTQVDPVMSICNQLKHPYLGYSAFVPLSISIGGNCRVSCMIIAHHGFGGTNARKEGGSLNAYIDHALRFEGWDIAAYGHRHDKWVKVVPRIAPQESGRSTKQPWIRATDRTVLQCGTYLRTLSHSDYPTYSERAGYPPRPLGCIKLKIGVQRDQHGGRDNRILKVISTSV